MSAVQLVEDPIEPVEDTFSDLLRFYRERAKRSRNSLAHAAGVDTSYLTRIENNDRGAPRPGVVEALARELRLTRHEADRFFVAAGYAPPRVTCVLRTWDAGLEAVTDVLCNARLTQDEKDGFRAVVCAIAERWQMGARKS